MAARKFLVHLDLNKNQLQNSLLHNVSGTPGGVIASQIWYDTADNIPKVYNGSIALKLYQSAVDVPFDNTTLSLAGSPATVQAALNTATASANINTLVRRDGAGRFQAASPAADDDVATKAYVDASRAGLDVKNSVRVATTTAGTLASSFENGDTVDGVVLATGNRILIKDQAAGAENGIYVVQASGAPVRAVDADTDAEVNPGMFTFVEEGTDNGDTGWVLTNNGTVTLGSTALVFGQFSGVGALIAGNGLTKTGNTIDVGAGSGITVNANDVAINLGSNSGLNTTSGLVIDASLAGAGLTLSTGVLAVNVDNSTIEINVDTLRVKDLGITTAKLADDSVTAAKINADVAGSGLTQGGGGELNVNTGNGIEIVGDAVAVNIAANAGLAFVSSELAVTFDDGVNVVTPFVARKAVATIGNGSATSFAITHSFGTTDVTVHVYENIAGGTQQEVEVQHTNTTQITVVFNVAPTSNQFKVVIIG